jgi:hypothetical protein
LFAAVAAELLAELLFAVVAAELLAELALWLGTSTPWTLGAPLAPGSAAAIAPPALPMRRPVKSAQAPATERRCVEMGSSSQKQGTSSADYRR